MNRSFQTKSQPYRVTQKEGSGEPPSHTQHKCSLGAFQLCLARPKTQLHQRPPVWGRYLRQVNVQEAIADGRKPVQKAYAWSSILTEIRSSSRPQRVSLLQMGFYRSVAKRDQASPYPRHPASLSHTLGQPTLGQEECSVWGVMSLNLTHDLRDLRDQEDREVSRSCLQCPTPPSREPDLLTRYSWQGLIQLPKNWRSRSPRI